MTSSSSALTIRVLAENDVEAVNRILQASYGDVNNRIPRVRRYLRLQPDGWFLALLDNAPVGVVGTINYGPFAYCGLLGVHPYAQRKGIGSLLMQQVLDWLDIRHCPLVVLDAINTSVPLYRKLGFVIDDAVQVFRSDGIVPPAVSSPRIRMLRSTDLPAISAFDQPLFGADRSTVFEEVLMECQGNAFATFGAGGRITGYLFAQAKTLGPWAADNPADAEALLQAALPYYPAGGAQVIVPTANKAAVALLGRYGFRAQLMLRHMRRGGAANPGDRAQLYGQTSLVIG